MKSALSMYTHYYTYRDFSNLVKIGKNIEGFDIWALLKLWIIKKLFNLCFFVIGEVRVCWIISDEKFEKKYLVIDS